tara:strand:- start:922 stop:1452 length:531 start_codon:yes stop_codon:yes gene_type:complete
MMMLKQLAAAIIVSVFEIKCHGHGHGHGGHSGHHSSGHSNSHSNSHRKSNGETNNVGRVVIAGLIISESVHVVRTEDSWFTRCVFYTENDDSLEETSSNTTNITTYTNSSNESNSTVATSLELDGDSEVKKHCETDYIIPILLVIVILGVISIFGSLCYESKNYNKDANRHFREMV